MCSEQIPTPPDQRGACTAKWCHRSVPPSETKHLTTRSTTPAVPGSGEAVEARGDRRALAVARLWHGAMLSVWPPIEARF